MYDFVIVHGSFGHPFENWEPSLFEFLESKGKTVLAPQFPCIDQSYSNWKKVIDAYLPFVDEHTSFIGHSLGPAFILDFLLDSEIKVNNLYFAAPFYGFINIKAFDDVNKTFFMYDDLTKAQKLFNKAFCFFSDNDPYVPHYLSESISEQLGADKIIIPGGGHLNASSGINEFQELQEVIIKNEKRVQPDTGT